MNDNNRNFGSNKIVSGKTAFQLGAEFFDFHFCLPLFTTSHVRDSRIRHGYGRRVLLQITGRSSLLRVMTYCFHCKP